jgi:acyl dehydratase
MANPTTPRTLDSSPAILPLYARAAAALIPGASLLPFVPGRGKDVPDLELTLAGMRPNPEAVAAYAKVCGFSLRDHLPPTYHQVLAFPLHMAVMADGRFPFGAVGLVHIENRIVQHRPVRLEEELKLCVRPTGLQPHKHGKTFSLITEVWSGKQKAWESTSTMLRRGGEGVVEVSTAMRPQPQPRPDDEGASDGRELTPSAEWRLGGDLGRRYAAVSGDRNPIHLHSLTAKPLGFPSAIAHGMWTKARCLAALEGRLPDAFAVEVRFRKPIRLPGKVEFRSDAGSEEIEFAVRDAKRQMPHLDGHLEPVEAKSNSGRKSK